jgi:hypothetical protein
MMIRLKAWCICLALLLLTHFSFAQKDLYWISFTRYTSKNEPKKFLMQIDSAGNVVISPKVVLTEQQLDSDFTRFPATALSFDNKGNINLWTDGEKDDKKYIYKVEINKMSLKAEKITTEFKGTYSPWNFPILVGITQKAKSNFIVLEVVKSGAGFGGDRNLKSYRISINGNIQSSNSEISPLGGYSACGLGLSADGKDTFWFEQSDYYLFFYIQPLNEVGLPAEQRSLLGRENTSCSADITNTIFGNKKFVLYTYNETNTAAGPTQLFLEPIDSETARPVEEKIILARVKGTIGGTAIDPMGRFVILSARERGHTGALLFINLDSKGHLTGEPKVLIKDAFPSGIDLLKEN